MPTGTDRTILKSVQKGHAGSAGVVDTEGAVNAAHQRSYNFQLTDGGTAGTACTEAGVAMPKACKVTSVYFTAPVAIAGSATNNKVFTVAKRVAGVSTTIGTFTLTVANAMTAFVPVLLSATNGTFTDSVNLASGDALTVAAAVGGTGIAIASATAFFSVTAVVEEI